MYIKCSIKKPKFEIRFTPSGFKEIGIVKYEFLKNLSPFKSN